LRVDKKGKKVKSFYPVAEEWMLNFPVGTIDKIWTNKIAQYSEPSCAAGVVEISWTELRTALEQHDMSKLERWIDSLAQGYFFVIKSFLLKSELDEINMIFLSLQKNHESSFHKIVDGVPNFWRDITEELSTRYAVPQVKKTSYWFHWNEDSKRVYELIMPIYRAFKALGGKSPIEYEKNIPSTGKVDRIQIVHYPAGTGRLEPHHDPKESQRLIMSGYTTRKGMDFHGGGFWASGSNNEKIDMEPFLEPGDFGTCYANIVHGVDATQFGDRGFIGLYSVDSDYKLERDTIKPAR
jgi:hypothetical protein